MSPFPHSFRKHPVILPVAALVFFVCAWVTVGLTASLPEAREASYTVYAKGIPVGELKTVCTLIPYRKQTALKFESSTRINANFLVYCYRLENHEEAIVGPDGTERYRRSTREKDSVSQVEGRLDHGRFLLDVAENGAKRSMAVNREEYDYTTMECPEITLKREGEEKALRLLDLETLSVVTRRYKWAKSEDVTVDGKRLHCRVIDFEDPHKKCRRWVSVGEPGVIITRQDGTGKSGSYSLRMTHLRGGG